MHWLKSTLRLTNLWLIARTNSGRALKQATGLHFRDQSIHQRSPCIALSMMMLQMSLHCIFILEYVVEYGSLAALFANNQLVAQLTTEDPFAVGVL